MAVSLGQCEPRNASIAQAGEVCRVHGTQVDVVDRGLFALKANVSTNISQAALKLAAPPGPGGITTLCPPLEVHESSGAWRKDDFSA